MYIQFITILFRVNQLNFGWLLFKLSVALDFTKADAVKMINQTNQMMENYLDISKNIINQNIDDW